ncbi:glycoside hydrolase family 3 protein [Flavobacteriaceae bacterium 3-367]
MNDISPYHTATTTLTLREKVGQLFMPAAFINDTEEEIRRLEDLIKTHKIGSLCFFHSRASAATNFEGKKEVIYNENSLATLKKLIRRYQKVSKIPLLIAIDAEWGLAMRIENTPQFPYAISLGAITHGTDLIFEVGRCIARDCREAGIHWNLSPVADINNNPDNPVIGYRSFGEDKQKVAEKAVAYVKGTQSEGVLTSVKHFPGHGDTATDSHLGLPLIEKTKETLLQNELYPFRELVQQGVDSVMVGHLAVPSLTQGKLIPATVSKEIIKDVLRKELHFEGIVISDALNMHSVSKMYPQKGELEWLAFDAGNDVLCFAEHVAEGIGTILQKASETQIEESFERVWRLKEKGYSKPFPTKGNPMSTSELNKALAAEILTLFKGDEATISALIDEEFIGISLGKGTETIFFESISLSVPFKTFEPFQKVAPQLPPAENILLALFPPQVKPTDNFGIGPEEIQWINELIRVKNVILYVFGNPYVLNKIRTREAKAVVLAYQDFTVFQQLAADHFLAIHSARGTLPVSIDSRAI